MVSIQFPDGAKRQYEDGVTGLEIAKSISGKLAKKAMVIRVNGEDRDLSRPVEDGATVDIITRDDERALAHIRHDAAHVMAEAVQELFPGTQVTIGPAIDDGFYYDFAREEPFHLEDLGKIEAKMREIVSRNESFTREEWDRDEAIAFFEQRGEAYKAELIRDLPESETISIYRQGEWLDLCRGPHAPSTGKIGQAFKLMKLAGAYWRGNSDNEMLQRIYGTAWADEKQLKAYLRRLEEAEKRDHRRLGKEMNLFHFQDEAPGAVFWHPRGWQVFQSLVTYTRERNTEAGYQEVNTPELMDKSLWEASGHWEAFHENMYFSETPDERTYAVKPMNCPGHVQVFKNGLKSYRDLPLRLCEFGKVHRYEVHGALHGLMRVRAFTQDDAHVFCTAEQITSEVVAISRLILTIYEDFGFDDVRIKFSDRPEKRVGSDEVWDTAEQALKAGLESVGVEYSHNPGEGAFYGPKLEFVLRDAIGRDWQCGTVQVDLSMPARLGAYYIGEDSNKHTPVMIHRAMLGSLERFTGILLEHHAGKLPLWLAPVQAVVATVTQEADGYAREVAETLRAQGLRVEVDVRNEKIGYKVREHSVQKIPVILAVGAKEAEAKSVSIRRIGSKESRVAGLEETARALAEEALRPSLRHSIDQAA
ncbi:MAG: threonine--tRNA ligase [Myxococcota bacterium]